MKIRPSVRRLAALSLLALFLATGGSSGAVGRFSLGPLVPVSGISPFASCPFDNVAGQPGTNTLHSAVEPWLAVDPRNPFHMVAAWQQDRWSNGGARGNLVAVTDNGGLSWRPSLIRGLTPCD